MGSQEYYDPLLKEDQLVEWLTAVFLFGASVLSFIVFFKLKDHKSRLFFLLFAIFCLLSALEEISWGQRVFNIASNDFFIENSSQGEINVHNVFQKWFDMMTKHVAGVVLVIYGAFLPYLAEKIPALKRIFNNSIFLLPPPHLILSFIIAGIMMFDRPTGFEEELGEFFFSVCFFLFILFELLSARFISPGKQV